LPLQFTFMTFPFEVQTDRPQNVYKYCMNGSVFLSIYGNYIALLKGNYSKALPAQARAKRKVLSTL